MAILSATGKVYTINGGFNEFIQELLEDLGEGKPIEGALTVAGHEYWVILEYGSSPRTPNAGPSDDDAVVLSLPEGVPAAQHHQAWYPIRPRFAKKLVFIDSQGRKRVENIVHHPGVLGRGFIRRAIALIETSLVKELEALQQEDSFPSREELVDVVNRHLAYLLDAVRTATPEQDRIDKDGFLLDEDDAHDGTHLRDAWGISPAK